jgi:Beta-L-arabinofuranosidase, GH127
VINDFDRGRRTVLKAGALLVCGGAMGAAGARRAPAVEPQAPLAELRHAQVKFESGPGASIAVNGKRGSAPIVPGTFASIEREWRSADRVELDLPLRHRLQAVDAEHPNIVALSSGPLVLMRILDAEPASTAPLPRTSLLAAERVLGDKHQWTVRHDSKQLQLRAFADIDAQRYSAYQDIAAG